MKLFQFATPFIVTLFTLSKVNAKGYYCTKHIIIKEGDKCSGIYGFNEKKEYYVRDKDLLDFNPTLDCNNLNVGDQLCVDIDGEKSDQDRPWNAYFIKRGDTCDSIANDLGTSIQILQNINNYLRCDRIDNQVNVEIRYRRDGEYNPSFEGSKLVSIDGN
jgi:hypothetical protein